jgi:16S rRNA (guanine966-N2)-methyltransferase
MRANRAANQLRIIAGVWRGRRLVFAPVQGLRPTADRIRETLFNWLSPVIGGTRCLDLYAGSGALGFEAASRGAAEVVMVDNHSVVARTLREQRDLLGTDRVKIIEADVGTWLQGSPEPFDIVFLDPPFHANLLPGCIRQLEEKGWLAVPAWVYIEAERHLGLELPDDWDVYRDKHAGQVDYRLVRRTADR